MPTYFCSLPNARSGPGRRGKPVELITDDEGEIADFVKRWDTPGRGVYTCLNPLKDGATRRSIETVAAIVCLWVDIDFKDIGETPDEVMDRLLHLPLQPTEVRHSGNGLHIVWTLREPIESEDEAMFERAYALLGRLAACLSADPAPAHPAALLRMPWTHNSKQEGDGT